jgi:hypothetical protein
VGFIPDRVKPKTMKLVFVSSLKQQFADKRVTSLGHIILISSRPVFALSPYCCVLTREATNINLHRLWYDPTGVRTHDLPFVSLKFHHIIKKQFSEKNILKAEWSSP